MQSKPKICAFNITQEVFDELDARFSNIFFGSLGSIISNSSGIKSYNSSIYPKLEFPDNFHEYDIFILDLNNTKVENYFSHIHGTKLKSGYHEEFHFLLDTSQSSLDLRPFGLKNFQSKLLDIKRPTLTIIFPGKYKKYKYLEKDNIVREWDTFPITDLLPISPLEKSGSEIILSDSKDPIIQFFKSHQSQSFYNCSFDIPATNVIGQKMKVETFLYNTNNEAVSFSFTNAERTYLILPYFENMMSFIAAFFDNYCSNKYSYLFPENKANKWLSNVAYITAAEYILIEKKNTIINQFNLDIQKVDSQIAEKKLKYKFLSDTLIETGEPLVDSVKKLLEKFEFKKVEKVDQVSINGVLEEDLKITYENESTLLIEIKGIYGTSTDTDCSQVYKIINRRKNEQQRFDIYGCYIVNHQRNIEPLHRKNPPFSENQISDAKLDRRGLTTTWELYKAFLLVEKGILTKEFIRERLLKYGFINFIPDNILPIGCIIEVFSKKNVYILELENDISFSDELFFIQHDALTPIDIESLMLDNNTVNYASKCELGFKVKQKLKKGMIIYKRS